MLFLPNSKNSSPNDLVSPHANVIDGQCTEMEAENVGKFMKPQSESFEVFSFINETD